MANKKKNKKRRHKSSLFFIDKSWIWKPGVGIRCKRCKGGVASDFDGATTTEEAIEKMEKFHTKKQCDSMIELNKQAEENCPYPCCDDKRKGKKNNGKKSKNKKQEKASTGRQQ